MRVGPRGDREEGSWSDSARTALGYSFKEKYTRGVSVQETLLALSCCRADSANRALALSG